VDLQVGDTIDSVIEALQKRDPELFIIIEKLQMRKAKLTKELEELERLGIFEEIFWSITGVFTA
jgi:hypothetical protein